MVKRMCLFLMKPRSGKCRCGFSLIEVMVAMTILSVIVLIVAGIFQQTSLAWSLGLQRADEQTMVRAVAGAVTRDLSMIVDPTQFVIGASESDDGVRSEALSEGGLQSGVGGSLGGGSMEFYILKPADDVLGDESVKREVVLVSYSGGGGNVTRKESPVDSGSSSSATFKLGNGSVTFDAVNQTDYEGYASLYDNSAVKVTIKPVTPETIDDYEISVGSCGPDGKWGTDDDIRFWVEGEDN